MGGGGVRYAGEAPRLVGASEIFFAHKKSMMHIIIVWNAMDLLYESVYYIKYNDVILLIATYIILLLTTKNISMLHLIYFV